jgi:hypothetical protein
MLPIHTNACKRPHHEMGTSKGGSARVAHYLPLLLSMTHGLLLLPLRLRAPAPAGLQEGLHGDA